MSSTFHLPQAVTDYVQRVGVREHPALSVCRDETKRDFAAQIGMQISPEQGAFMQTMAYLTRARTAVEVGVFTGYSSTAVALAMKALHGDKARLYACDISEEFVARARRTWKAAGVEEVIEARMGPAADSLQALLDQGLGGQVDLAFIDADKTGYDAYYELVLKLLHPGGLMLLDNMFRGGRVADPAANDPDTVALRALQEKIAADQRVEMTLASIGDGLTIVVKR